MCVKNDILKVVRNSQGKTRGLWCCLFIHLCSFTGKTQLLGTLLQQETDCDETVPSFDRGRSTPVDCKY